MGNEFGHPEWVDFPRPENGHSLAYARRRWDLADDPLLRYAQLMAFDAAMHCLQRVHPWLHARPPAGLEPRSPAPRTFAARYAHLSRRVDLPYISVLR